MDLGPAIVGQEMSGEEPQVAPEVKQEAAGSQATNHLKRKAEATPRQPRGKPRAKLRHSEVGALPTTEEGSPSAPGGGVVEVIAAAGFAKAGKRKSGKLTLADYPSIARRWHPTKNGGKRPEDHKHANKERVWLLCGGCPVCLERHQWDARVDNLTQYGDNLMCPFCTSKGPSFCSCRSVAKNAHLATEWHEDNPAPSTIALGNDKKHKWRCSEPTCLHIWDASPASRSTSGANCPECARKRKGKVRHASLAVSCPELALEWDEAKNGRPANAVSAGSKKKGWWVCGRCEESFETRVQNRALLGTGCPRCRKARNLA